MRTAPATALSLAAAAAVGVLVATSSTSPTGTNRQASTPGGSAKQAESSTPAYPVGALPDPRLTPGDTLPVTAQDVCQPGYAGRVRNVPESVKRQVYLEYHAARGSPPAEADHDVSLELGGSNSIRNLWPQPYSLNWNGKDVGAHTKDRLEDRLHTLLCQGRLTLAEAQAAIRGDWIVAYQKYVGPLPPFQPEAPVVPTEKP